MIPPEKEWPGRDLTKYFCKIASVAGWVNDYIPHVILVLDKIAFISIRMQTKNAEGTLQHMIASISNAASAPTIQAHSLAPLPIGQFSQAVRAFSSTGIQQPAIK